MSKLQKILIGALVAQLALAVVVFFPRNTAGAGGQSLLGVAANEITGITITGDQGEGMKLAKVGDAWVLPDAGAYPADAAKITPVLDKLAAIKTGRRVAQTAASHAQLQVADDKFSRKVELATPGGAKVLLLGSSAGGQATHVRLAGQDDVYIATGISPWEIAGEVTSWITTAYVNIPPADVTGLTLRNAAGEWSFRKDGQGAWTQVSGPGEGVDPAAVSGLVTSLASLSMSEPVGKDAGDPALGLGQPLAVAALTYRSGDAEKTTTINIGAKDGTGASYAVKSSDSEYVVRVPEYAVKDAVERTTFAAATPTPSAGAAPAGTPASVPTP